ncbi:hypothetical protein [Ketogulonicigenium vulgare]|uniref:hypothetical protein n=1 Tax=Ketogulonicigenium vulgare TaxID=92945 RepID=UPI0023592746|nr:hypothetical protein [Ketogulonicigenium vulgare]
MSRSHYLPSRNTLSNMYQSNRETILELHLKDINEEIAGLKSGYIIVTDGRGKAHHLKLANARRRHVLKVAKEFDYEVPEQAA